MHEIVRNLASGGEVAAQLFDAALRQVGGTRFRDLEASDAHGSERVRPFRYAGMRPYGFIGRIAG
jgi:hypothetical protein